MIHSSEPPPDRFEQELEREVSARESRKLKARRERHRSVWYGLGMFGMIGWTVAIPTLIGVALGLWIDRTFPNRFSWTLMLLVGGVVTGSVMAWRWVKQESESD